MAETRQGNGKKMQGERKASTALDGGETCSKIKNGLLILKRRVLQPNSQNHGRDIACERLAKR